jgi:hypothetical protein
MCMRERACTFGTFLYMRGRMGFQKQGETIVVTPDTFITTFRDR